jgi:23S rRNA (guanine745-N1)-methyltransferase
VLFFMNDESLFVCPVCRLQLQRVDRQLVCGNAHAFDVSKQGYVNLLLAQHRQSKDPGYSKAMIASRRDFFDAGHYERLADTLATTVMQYVAETGRVSQGVRDGRATAGAVIDAGCGEGYYLRRIRNHCSASAEHTPVLCGVDISKHGVQVAARRDPAGQYAVASTHELPVRPGAAQLLLTHFSPVFAPAFAIALQPNGVLLVGGPGPTHLSGLKSLVYAEPHDHGPLPQLDSHSGFALVGTHRVQYDLALRSAVDVANLLAMTPFYWSAGVATQQRLAQLDELDTPVDVVVHAYRLRTE